MRVGPKNFEATLNAPFANDKLGRQKHVKQSVAIAEMDGPAVVALDGGWAPARQRSSRCRRRGCKRSTRSAVVEFNAWTQGHT